MPTSFNQTQFRVNPLPDSKGKRSKHVACFTLTGEPTSLIANTVVTETGIITDLPFTNDFVKRLKCVALADNLGNSYVFPEIFWREITKEPGLGWFTKL